VWRKQAIIYFIYMMLSREWDRKGLSCRSSTKRAYCIIWVSIFLWIKEIVLKLMNEFSCLEKAQIFDTHTHIPCGGNKPLFTSYIWCYLENETGKDWAAEVVQSGHIACIIWVSIFLWIKEIVLKLMNEFSCLEKAQIFDTHTHFKNLK